MENQEDLPAQVEDTELVIQLSYCHYCKSPIAIDALICKECSQYQGKYRFINTIKNGATVATIIMALIVLSQLIVTCQESAEINNAFKLAEKAQNAVAVLGPQIESAKRDLSNLNTEIAKTTDFLSHANELNLSIAEARYNIDHLKRLKEISNSNNYPYDKLQEQAKSAYNRIRIEIEGWYPIIVKNYTFENSPSFYYWDTTDFDFDRLLNFFNEIDQDLQGVFPNYLWGQKKRFTESQRLLGLSTILKQTKNPFAIAVACSILKNEYKLDEDVLFNKEVYISFCENKIKEIQ